MSQFGGSFILLVFAVGALKLYASRFASSGSVFEGATKQQADVEVTTFQRNYLLVFLLAMFSDWLQGPYVYELYVSYGFSQQEIAELFVCGFGSSMVVGTFVAGLADKYGRKNMCILYGFCYIAACLTKLVPSYGILMIGRFLSGIATSLLFSAFESWMVTEHGRRGFESQSLGETFAHATFGNGVIAVLAGLAANFVADIYGPIAPFMMAILPLSLLVFLVAGSWTENYGNQDLSMTDSLSRGFDLVRRDSTVAALVVSQSCFEGAMYTFVFMWTPALKSREEKLAEAEGLEPNEHATSQYLGLIFACFMVSVMLGSTLFGLLNTSTAALHRIPLYLHSAAVLAMGCVSFRLENKMVVYWMFLVFEITVGLFYPAYGCLKSDAIPSSCG